MVDTVDIQETLRKYDIYHGEEDELKSKLKEGVDEGTKSYNDWLIGKNSTTPINIDSYWNFHTHTSPRIEVEFRVPALGKEGEYEWVNINSNEKNKVQVETSNGKPITVNSSATNNYFVSANIVDTGFKEVELVLYDRNFTNLMSLIESAIYSVNKSTTATTSINKKENTEEYKIENGALNLNFFKAATPITTNLRIRYGYSEDRGEQVIGNSEGNGYKGSIKEGTIIDRWNSTRDSTDSDKSKTLDDDAITAERVLQYFQQATIISNWDEYFITGLSTTLTETGLKYTIKAISTETFTLNGYKMYQQYSKIVGRPKTVMATLMRTFNKGELMKLVWADSAIEADKSTINGSQIVPDYETDKGKNKVITEEEVNQKRDSVNTALNSLRMYLSMLKDLLACFKENQLNTLSSYFGGKNIEYQSLISSTDNTYDFESKSFMDLAAWIYNEKDNISNMEHLKNVSVWCDSVSNNYDFLINYVGNRNGGGDKHTTSRLGNAKKIWLSGIAFKAYNLEGINKDSPLSSLRKKSEEEKKSEGEYVKGKTSFDNFLEIINNRLQIKWGYTSPSDHNTVLKNTSPDTYREQYYKMGGDDGLELFGSSLFGNYSYVSLSYEDLMKEWKSYYNGENNLSDAKKIFYDAIEEFRENNMKVIAKGYADSFLDGLFAENIKSLTIIEDSKGIGDPTIIDKMCDAGNDTFYMANMDKYIREQISPSEKNSLYSLVSSLLEGYVPKNEELVKWSEQLRKKMGVLIDLDSEYNPNLNIDKVGLNKDLSLNWPPIFERDSSTKKMKISDEAKNVLIPDGKGLESLLEDLSKEEIAYQVIKGGERIQMWAKNSSNRNGHSFEIVSTFGYEIPSGDVSEIVFYNFNRLRKFIYYTWKISNNNFFEDVSNIDFIENTEHQKNIVENYKKFLNSTKQVINSKKEEEILSDFDNYKKSIAGAEAETKKYKYIKDYLLEEANYINSESYENVKLKEFYIDDSHTEEFGKVDIAKNISHDEDKISLSNYLEDGFSFLNKDTDMKKVYIDSLEKKIAFLSSNLSNLEKKKQKLDSTNIGKDIELSLGSQESQNPDLKLTKTVSSLLNDFCSQCQPCIDNKETVLINKNYVVQDETGNEKKVSVYENYPRYNLTWGVLGKDKKTNAPLIGFYYRRPIKQRYLRVYNWGTGNPRQHCVKALNVSSGSEFAMLQQYNIAEAEETGVKIKKIVNGKVKEVDNVMPDNKSPCFFTTLLESKRDSNIFNNLYNSIYKGSITLLGDPSLKFQGIIQPYTYPIYLDIKLQREGKSWSSNDGDNTIMSYTSGFYVVTKITHNISTSGYTTTLDIMKYPGSDDQYIK